MEIRNKIRYGGTAFMNLLPYPKVHQMKDEHVYVLPSECIKHFLASGGIPMEFNTENVEYPYTQFNESPRGVALTHMFKNISKGKSLRKRHFNISFLEWKDDCETAKSNKASKYNTWIFTITIFKNKRGYDSPLATFPIAMGPKSKKHDTVEKIIAKDLALMRSTRIESIVGWSELGAPFPCTFSADLYLSLGDQPERRGGNELMQGGSRTHARWR